MMAGPPEPKSADEPTLVTRAGSGDVPAFEELVRRHADRLYMALRHFGLDESEAQEVAQETFLRAWRGLKGFGSRSGFFTWLYRIGFNEAQRRLARRPPAEVLVSTDGRRLHELADETPGPADRAELEELRAALAQALLQLPPILRAPVVLRDVEGLTTQEAAAILDVGEAAFKSRLHRGRLGLRERVDRRLTVELGGIPEPSAPPRGSQRL